MVKMDKAQGMITIIVGIFFMVGIFVLAAFILNSIKEVEYQVTNTLDADSNITDQDFGNPVIGNDIKEKAKKSKNSNIAPPELSTG